MPPNKRALEQLRIDQEDRAPQRSGRAWIFILIAVVAAAAIGAWRLLERVRVPQVQVAVVREVARGQQSAVLNASGYVTARRQATVSSKVMGKVARVDIEEGMRVEEGQVLAILDQSNVQVSLELASAELAAARSALAETEVRLAEAERELERVRGLIRGEVASEADLDRAQATRDALAARIVSQRNDVAVAAGQLAVWRQQREDTIIRAPFAGVVVAKNAQEGEMISPNSAGGFTRTGIGTIVDMSSLEVEVDVNEAYINRVKPDQRVDAVLDSYPDWRIPARVIAIIPTADRQRATVTVRIGLDELDPRILPDMGVKVTFHDDREAVAEAPAQAAVVVPRSALRADGGRDVVYALAGDRIERRAVALGATRDEQVQVLSGLSAGERVVVAGPPELKEGDRVEVVER